MSSPVQFQGIYRYRESESARIKAEALREHGVLGEGESLVSRQLRGPTLEAISTVGPHAVTRAMRTVSEDGRSVLTGVLLTERDAADFWVSRYPEHFSRADFEQVGQLRAETQVAREAFEPYRNFLESLSLGGWLVRKLTGNKKLREAEAAEETFQTAFFTLVPVEEDLWLQRQFPLQHAHPDFEQKLFDYVESHPTAADGTGRVDEWIA